MRVIAFRQFQNELVRAGQLGRLDHLLHRQPRIGQRDVVSHGTVEEKIFLEHDSHLPTQPGRVHLREIDTIDEDAPAFRHIQPLNQLGNGALAGPGASHDAR